MTSSNEVILAYFQEIRYLNVLLSSMIDSINHNSDSIQRVILEHLNNDRNSSTSERSSFSRRTGLNRRNRFLNSFGTGISPPPPPMMRPSSLIRETISPIDEENENQPEDVVFTGVVDLTPVSIYPSMRQIMNATEMLRYGDIENPINATCPIRQENFSENDRVCQIKHCKHIFKDMCLYNWFLEHVDCPVCRFDIREDENNRNTSNEDYTVTSSRDLPPEIINSFTRMVNQSLLGVRPRLNMPSTDV